MGVPYHHTLQTILHMVASQDDPSKHESDGTDHSWAQRAPGTPASWPYSSYSPPLCLSGLSSHHSSHWLDSCPSYSLPILSNTPGLLFPAPAGLLPGSMQASAPRSASTLYHNITYTFALYSSYTIWFFFLALDTWNIFLYHSPTPPTHTPIQKYSKTRALWGQGLCFVSQLCVSSGSGAALTHRCSWILF